jgi:hypothetical protein
MVRHRPAVAQENRNRVGLELDAKKGGVDA